ncbi:beta-galactosidase [Paenibacillus silvisoli]|uniref:beta-galactosidase n=1 Tax=Paenibacillus silvisoli TaxID=3110539 RepID=UPI002803926B|nr:beta-galactosidase [Paenibacillus silvisoli]
MANRFFTTLRKDDGSWALISPDGSEFFSLGVNCVYFPDNLSIDNIQSYGGGSEWYQRFADRKLEQIKEYGFNTLAAWHEKYYWGDPTPKTVELSLSRLAAKVNTDWGVGFPDVFCESFAFSIHRVLCDHFYGQGAVLKDDPALIGYFTDNELHWWGQGGHWGMNEPAKGAVQTNLVLDYIALPATAAGKRKWVSFIEGRYGTVDRLNEAWNSEYWEFNDLLGVSMYTADTEQYEQDKLDFLRLIADTYYKTTSELLRQYDPNHLIMGCRLVGASTPEVVLEAMAPYVDVVSLNFYTRYFPGKWLTKVSEITGKPVMIGEFSMCAGRQAGYLNSTNGAQNATVRDQKRRAELYAKFVQEAAELPACVGAHWFALYDYGRDRHGLIGNYGLLQMNDEPWEEFVEAVTASNRGLNAAPAAAKPIG